MNGNVIRTITIRGQAEGLDKLTADINKLAAAEQNVAIVSEQSAKRVLSLEDAWKRQTLRLDEAARAQANIARETKVADAALREGLATQAQHAQRLEQINQRYVTTASGVQTYGKALQQGTGEARLARHEMINLSRQIQDVGVSLASGQAPLTVLVQQGSQIADVFATSSGTIRGFFGQIATGAARFLTSTAGMATGAAAIGVALVSAGASAASAQRDIEKGLSGIGRASGVTRDQINAIGEASSSAFGISRSEAMTAATAFAATGKIYAANVSQATRLVNAYARAGGDAAEITKTLGAALQDPAKGALELNKQLGFLNAATLENIRLLQSQGKEQEAQKTLMDALAPAYQKQAEQIGTWTKLWNLATNAASNYFSQLGKDVLTVGEKATGASLGGFTTGEQLGRAQERQMERRASPFQGALAQPGIKAGDLEVARLEAKLLAEELDKASAAFNKLGTEAQAAADGFLPLQEQVRQTEQALAKLREYQAAGGFVDAAAITAGELRAQQLREQANAVFRQNEYTQAIAAAYPGMSIQVAMQLNALQGQLQIAQARTGAERMIAQELVTQNALRLQGLTHEEATRIAADQRAVAEANISKEIAKQIQALEDQVELSKARVNGTEDAVKAEQAYAQAIRDGAQEAEAAALRRANLEASAAANLEGVGNQIRNNTVYQQQFNDAALSGYKTLEQWNDAGVRFPYPKQFGRDEEFVSSYDPLGIQRQKESLEKLYGAQNVEAVAQGAGIGAFETYRLKESYAKDMSTNSKSLEDLTVSTDALNATMQNALSPYYSQDPRTTRLGFRAGVTGNPDWLAAGASNENPLAAILGPGATAPGMANGGSFVVGGGDSATDNRLAAFPVASGEQIVVNRNRTQGRGGNVINIDNRTIINGSVDVDTMAKLKITKFQQSQRMRGALAQA